jgi:hypothetical protein
MILETLLTKFDKTLREYNLSNYHRLFPPLTESKIDAFLKSLEIDDEDLKKLFLWKNGFDPNQDPQIICQIFDCDLLLSINIIPDYIAANREYWNNYFIPLLTDTTGKYVLFNNKVGEDYGKLYLYSNPLFIIEPISYYDSIYSMIETTIEAYIQEVFKYNEEEDWLDINLNRFNTLAAKINTKSNHWKK